MCALIVVGACEPTEQLRDRFRDLTPREAYGESLEAAGLHETALGMDWAAAGAHALEDPTPISLPFAEDGHIAPESPAAVAYRIEIARGRRLTFQVDMDSREGTRLFVDLFRMPANGDGPPRPVFSSDSVATTFVYEPAWRGGEFLLRVQPELLRGGRFRVTVRAEAELGFPVEGRTMTSILSFFGAPRDGGRRRHHGVDIFAPRGTPVLAATSGRVRGVRVTDLGGKVVWIDDVERDARTYYAHLDSQFVRNGQWVERGDTVGFVGNTGNARTTPPHLHFGLYRRGPLDPYPFLDPPERDPPALTADVALLGERVRVPGEAVPLRASPRSGSPILGEVAAGSSLRVTGAAGDWFRVRAPDGASGFVAAGWTEAAAAVSVDGEQDAGETGAP